MYKNWHPAARKLWSLLPIDHRKHTAEHFSAVIHMSVAKIAPKRGAGEQEEPEAVELLKGVPDEVLVEILSQIDPAALAMLKEKSQRMDSVANSKAHIEAILHGMTSTALVNLFLVLGTRQDGTKIAYIPLVARELDASDEAKQLLLASSATWTMPIFPVWVLAISMESQDIKTHILAANHALIPHALDLSQQRRALELQQRTRDAMQVLDKERIKLREALARTADLDMSVVSNVYTQLRQAYSDYDATKAQLQQTEILSKNINLLGNPEPWRIFSDQFRLLLPTGACVLAVRTHIDVVGGQVQSQISRDTFATASSSLGAIFQYYQLEMLARSLDSAGPDDFIIDDRIEDALGTTYERRNFPWPPQFLTNVGSLTRAAWRELIKTGKATLYFDDKGERAVNALSVFLKPNEELMSSYADTRKRIMDKRERRVEQATKRLEEAEADNTVARDEYTAIVADRSKYDKKAVADASARYTHTQAIVATARLALQKVSSGDDEDLAAIIAENEASALINALLSYDADNALFGQPPSQMPSTKQEVGDYEAWLRKLEKRIYAFDLADPFVRASLMIRKEMAEALRSLLIIIHHDIASMALQFLQSKAFPSGAPLAPFYEPVIVTRSPVFSIPLPQARKKPKSSELVPPPALPPPPVLPKAFPPGAATTPTQSSIAF